MVPSLQFDRSAITVAGGGTITVNVSNRDTGVAHNFAVYTDSTAARPVPGAAAENCVAPCSFSVSFAAPPPGTYFFRCDVHPADMNGAFIVQ